MDEKALNKRDKAALAAHRQALRLRAHSAKLRAAMALDADRIAKIESTLQSAPNLPAETISELLSLLAELKAEVGPLSPPRFRAADLILTD